MPLTYERLFRVRYTECDAYGHVNNVNYLRYLQEAAFEATAAAGYDMQRYAALGHYWLVRGTFIEYLRPLVYGDTLRVRTWVEDFRRAVSRRRYELTQAASGEVAARAYSDWVYVDAEHKRPASIPPELIAAFYPEGAPPPGPPREPFPAAPPPPGVFTWRVGVRWADIDSAWHVNNAVYAGYAEEAVFALLPAHGWSLARMEAEGFALVPRQHQLEYRLPAELGDQVDVSTWFSDARRASVVRHFVFRRAADQEVLARLRTLYVGVSRASGQPIRIPEHFLADHAPNQAP